MATPEQWFKTMPIITKTWFVTSLVATALISFQFMSPWWLYLDLDLVFRKFQLWRLVTCFIFFGKFSLNFVFAMFLMVRYTRMLEETKFIGNRGTAEMIFMMIFGASVMIFISWLWGGLPFLSSALVFMLLYYWSRTDPYRPVVFWGFTFQAWQFPFVMVVVSVLIGASPLLDLIGIVVGHLYHYLMDIVPKIYGRTLLKCPEFMYGFFDQQNVVGRAQHWNRGTGHRLGN